MVQNVIVIRHKTAQGKWPKWASLIVSHSIYVTCLSIYFCLLVSSVNIHAYINRPWHGRTYLVRVSVSSVDVIIIKTWMNSFLIVVTWLTMNCASIYFTWFNHSCQLQTNAQYKMTNKSKKCITSFVNTNKILLFES